MSLLFDTCHSCSCLWAYALILPTSLYLSTSSGKCLSTSRYSYHHKLIPLLLTCTNDDLADIRTKSYLLWDKVLHYTSLCNTYLYVCSYSVVSLQIGSKYEEENEDDLKDKLDFIQPIQVAPILGTIMHTLLHVKLLLYVYTYF